MARIGRSLAQAKGYLEDFGFGQIEPIVKAISILLVLFGVFHLSELTNFTLSIDDEYTAFRENAAAWNCPDPCWLKQGRWTAYLFGQFVLQQPILPFLPLALFGLFCSIGYLLFLGAIGQARYDPLSFAFFPLFSAFPTWYFLTAFRSNTPAAGLGVLFSCWAAFLFRRDRERPVGASSLVRVVLPIAIAGLVGAAAIASYQSFFLFLTITLLASIISMSFAGRPARLLLRDCVAAIAILGVSLVLYAVILKLFLVLSRTSIIYIQLFLHPADLFDQPAQVAVRVLGQMNDIYFGRQSVYGYESSIIIVFIVLAAGGVIYHAYRTAGVKGGFFGGLTILALLTVPFAMNLMSGGIMPVRSLVAVPVALTSLGLLGFKYGPQWLARIGMIVLTLSCFYILKSLSGFNAAQELVQLHDRLMALALSERIASVAGPTEPGKPLTLDVFGFKSFQTPFPRIADSTVGASFFEWDRGNPDRIVTYMKLIGLPTFKVVAPERRIKFLDEFVMMPAWPAGGSVRAAADGTILVKLADVPNQYYRELLVGKDPSAKVNDLAFFRLSTAMGRSWSVQNVAPPQRSTEGIELDTKYDPQFIFRIGALGTAENCRRIELHTRLRVERPTSVQIFYKKPGQTDFQEDMSTETQVSPAADGGFVDVNLQIISREGFADSFRLDPVQGYQRVTIGEIELYCRYPLPVGG